MYSSSFADEPARRFMVGFLRGVRDFNAAFDNRPVDDAIVAILVQHTTVKDPAAWQTARPAPINQNGYTYPENIQRSQDYFVANGIVQQPVDLSRFDRSLLRRLRAGASRPRRERRAVTEYSAPDTREPRSG